MLQKVSILSPLAGVPRCLILAATVFEAFIFNYYPVNPAYRGRLISFLVQPGKIAHRFVTRFLFETCSSAVIYPLSHAPEFRCSDALPRGVKAYIYIFIHHQMVATHTQSENRK